MGLKKIWRFYVSGHFGVFWIVLRLFSAVLGRFGSFGSVLAIQDCQIRLAKVKSDNLTSESRRYPHRKFWRSLYGTNFLEISNGRKTVRMAPILTIFGPNESQRCQLNFEKNLGRRKNFREGEKFEKVSRKVRKILSRTRFLGRNKIETATSLR